MTDPLKPKNTKQNGVRMIKKTHLESMGSGFRQFVAFVTYMWWNQPVTLHILISRLSIIFSGCALPLDPKNLLQFRDRVTYPTIIQWICSRENLQETWSLPPIIGVSYRCSLKPIQWMIFGEVSWGPWKGTTPSPVLREQSTNDACRLPGGQNRSVWKRKNTSLIISFPI